MRRTKIVCTVGPSVDGPNMISKLIEAGMDVARFNLSHGRSEEHAERLDIIRRVSEQKNSNTGILFDTRGPEIRTGDLEDEYIMLQDGQEFILTTIPVTGTGSKVSVTYPGLHDDLKPGAIIFIDDGMIELQVSAISGNDIVCRVLHGGELRSYKGLNTPGSKINLPAVGDADRKDIEMALDLNVDFLAASFARSAEDIIEIRRLVEKLGGSIMIIAKIECREGVNNYDSILEVSDGIMVARGDLGIEISPEEVPLLQKQFIQKSNRLGKPIITATQMLDSMIRNPRPTRAEASDVANAILDGSDAVMLSGETAIGKFPIESVQTMSRIAKHTEQGLDYDKLLAEYAPKIKNTVTDAISYATCHIAHELKADAIITATQSGYTARMVSKYRPKAPIIAVSSRRQVAGYLTLTRGVRAVICAPVNSTDEMFHNAIQASLAEKLIENGSLVVITAGVPVGVSGTTNLLRVETVGDILLKGTGVGNTAVAGKAAVIRNKEDMAKIGEGDIIITRHTDISFLPSIEKAAAMVIEEGGITSHGAIVAINLGKPAVVGVDQAVSSIQSGEIITVDAIRGLIYRGKVKVL